MVSPPQPLAGFSSDDEPTVNPKAAGGADIAFHVDDYQ